MVLGGRLGEGSGALVVLGVVSRCSEVGSGGPGDGSGGPGASGDDGSTGLAFGTPCAKHTRNATPKLNENDANSKPMKLTGARQEL